METVNGEWYMKGCARNDPARIRTAEELIAVVREEGFLPLFSGGVPGFSVEERTPADDWWTGDPASDPWEWRMLLAARDEIAYGKFFDQKAGFVSKEWFPAFANYRRDGYDFDALFDEGLAPYRAKKLMDALALDEQMRGRALPTYELKELAGFGNGGEKNFPGVLTQLQMQTYLIMGDFRRRRNKRGEPYGWHIAVMMTPETKWGYDHVSAGYVEAPADSRARIVRQVAARYPDADEAALRKALGLGRRGK